MRAIESELESAKKAIALLTSSKEVVCRQCLRVAHAE